MTSRWILPLSSVTLADVAEVGGKNASLGELLSALGPLGVRVPDGFAVTAAAYRRHLAANQLDAPIAALLAGARKEDVDDLAARAARLRALVADAPLPPEVDHALAEAYAALGPDAPVAARSSATAEDLPGASFAGQQESFLHVVGLPALRAAVARCFASLFTARAIAYRIDLGFAHARVGLSVGVQRMVRSDRGSAGVAFTLDPDSGCRQVVVIASAWGLGESVVQGTVQPDELYVHQAALRAGHRPVLWRKPGSKPTERVVDAATGAVVTRPVAPARQAAMSLSDDDALTLARWALAVEDHYAARAGQPTPMDLEWAKDGVTGELWVVQARPETVHARRDPGVLRTWHLAAHGAPLVLGVAVGEAIGVGPARVVDGPAALATVRPGEVIVTAATDPDWEPVMKRAAAIVTELGGRTSHAAIVARELGVPAVVGAEGARGKVTAGAPITVSCADGEVGCVYAGALPFSVEEVAIGALPATRTRLMINLAQPERALALAALPCDGVGLARMEFVLSGWVGVHPLALTRYHRLSPVARAAVDARLGGAVDRVEFYVDRLAQGIAMLAGAFWPRPVVLRFSDFKTNEYAGLIGGAAFEPTEANPMLGWRGASRYYDPEFRDGFALECAAVRRVRETMGLTNLDVMVPFCRTPEEGARVLDAAAAAGLRRGEGGPRWYVMAELPSNVLLADRFAELFDGFSIGSNDLTQLVLGVDRDAPRVARLFDERDEAVRRACVMLLEAAHAAGRPVGICGQAPSDYPEFAEFLVEHGIDSLGLSPDVVVAMRRRVAAVERRLDGRVAPAASPPAGW
jgi:pyruvate,water dikinase